MKEADWWTNCFFKNGLCICGIELGLNFDEKVFRYEPQLPKSINNIDTSHIWTDRMRQWRELIVMEKQTQFRFHSESNSPLKVVDWGSLQCWEDEPIIIWVKPSNYTRQKFQPRIPQPPQAPVQQQMWHYGIHMQYVVPMDPYWFHYGHYNGWH